ncbi:MAG: UDP-N-acetylmuramoyl-tripeptide--D-alanyl-D-alanine ligase, partial [Atopobiaceae bacterium]|nr:UDP-N-acetylmuramoyl-tripeptide--D-alanyl-D-alanine ligase [Atopobiaceae bacterium]
TIIDDSYNASPASMAAAIDVLCAFDCEGRRIAVLGEMGELGDDERLLHASVGAYTAAKDVDMLVTIGSGLASDIRGGASACGMSSDSMESFPDVESAIAVMGDVLAEGDVVLVKASRSAGLDAFVKGLIER